MLNLLPFFAPITNQSGARFGLATLFADLLRTSSNPLRRVEQVRPRRDGVILSPRLFIKKPTKGSTYVEPFAVFCPNNKSIGSNVRTCDPVRKPQRLDKEIPYVALSKFTLEAQLKLGKIVPDFCLLRCHVATLLKINRILCRYQKILQRIQTIAL